MVFYNMHWPTILCEQYNILTYIYLLAPSDPSCLMHTIWIVHARKIISFVGTTFVYNSQCRPGGVRVKPSSLIPGSSEFESWRIQNSSHLITFTVCKWSTRQNCLRKCQKLPPASFWSAAPASR